MAHNHPLHRKGNQRKNVFDYLVYFFMIATPLFELPQAWGIYSSKDAANVSLLTWGFFFMSSIVWLGYGINHRIRPFIIMYSIYIVVEASVVTGIILYR